MNEASPTIKPLIVILGPTASGKSALGVKTAKLIGGEVVSADSAQVYRDFTVLTARTTLEEMEGIPHHLTGFLDLGEEFSVARFQELAFKAIEGICRRGRIPIMVGGTFLYVKAVVEGYDFVNLPPEKSVRESLEKKAEKLGSEALYEELKRRDPAAAERIHPRNVRRVIRALEVMEITGDTFSSFYKKAESHPLGVEPIYVKIDLPRSSLYERINQRVDKMMHMGAMEEVESLLAMGKRDSLDKSRILGCREMMGIIDGSYTRMEGIELLKRNTRRYAKRQMTWIRSFPNPLLLKVTDEANLRNFNEIINVIEETLRFLDNKRKA